MTGGKSTRERLGAVFFAFVMVTSMVAVGGAAFAGSAAAVDGSVSTASDVVNDGGTIDITVDDGDYSGAGSYEVAVSSTTEPLQGDGTSINYPTDGTESIDLGVVLDSDGDGNVEQGAGEEIVFNDGSGDGDTVSVNDDGDGTFTLSVTSGTNPGLEAGDTLEVDLADTLPQETVSLSETGSGVFEGSINVEDAAANVGDGTIQADSDSETITVEYNDLDQSSVDSTTVTTDYTNPTLDSASVYDRDDDGDVDGANVDMSEAIDTGALSAGEFTIGGTTVDTVAADEYTDDSGSTSDTNPDVFRLTLNDGNEVDGTSGAEVAYSGSSLQDLAGNEAGDFTEASGDVTDNAQPVVDSTIVSSSSEVTVTFSEGVDDSSEALVTEDFNYIDNNAAGATDIGGAGVSHNGVSDDTARIATNNALSASDVGTDQIESGVNGIEDDSNNALVNEPVTTTIQDPNGVLTEAGDTNSDVSTSIGGNANQALSAGSASQELGVIRVTDVSGGNSPLAERTILTMPDGVTINEAQSNLVVTTTSGSLTVTGTQIVDESTLRIDHSGSSEDGQALRVNGLVVDTAPDVAASQTGTDNAINVDYAVGELDSNLLDVYKPQLTTGGQTTVSAGTQAQSLQTDLTVTAGSSVDGQIANQSNIVINANQTNGITFDTDTDPTNLQVTSASSKVDISSASLTSTALTIPVTGNFSAGEALVIDADNTDEDLDLDLVASGGASDAKFTADVEAVDSTGTVAAQTSGQTADVTVDKPQIDLTANGNVVVGANDQTIPNNLQIDVSNANIPANSEVVVSTNNSNVEFVNRANDDLTVANDLSGGDYLNFDSISINSDGDLVLGVGDSAIAATTPVDLANGDVGLDVSPTPEDETDVQFEMAIDNGVSDVDDSESLTLERPNLQFNNGNNASVSVDNDGVSNVNPDGNDALVITSDDVNGQISDATNVTVSLESDTGVTFSTDSAVEGDTTLNPDSIIDVQSSGTPAVNDFTVYEDRIEIELVDDNDDGPSTSLPMDGTITVDDFVLNATGDATDTTVSVTTNTSDNEITTDAQNLVTITESTASNIDADADGTGPFGDLDHEPTVGETTTGTVQVQNGGVFGGADVNLEVVETPEGSSGASLNTSTVTTASDGTASFNFTAGDTTGDYVVNATVASTGAGLNMTYDAQAGDVAGVSVTPIENAIAGDSTDLGVAALYVNSTDQYGNQVTGSSPTVEITADNVGASGVGFANDFDNAEKDITDDSLNNGQFSLHSTDGSSAVYVKSSQIENVTITADVSGTTDSGTVTFYDEVGQVDVSLNNTDVAPGTTVQANATIAQSDGTTIAVPDYQVDFNDNGNSNTTVNSATAQTNTMGVAGVTVTADAEGTSTIRSSANLKQDSAVLTISQPAYEITDVSLDPNNVTANTTVDHDLSYTVTNASNDGNTDTYTVTLPSSASFDNAGNSLTVTDADGNEIQVEGGPSLADANNGSDNQITFDIAPDNNFDTTAVTVEANVTVNFPDVSESTTAPVTLNVSDSSQGDTSAQTDVTIEADGDTDSPLDGTAGEYDNDGDGTVTASELGDAVNDFGQGNLSAAELGDVINAFGQS